MEQKDFALMEQKDESNEKLQRLVEPYYSSKIALFPRVLLTEVEIA